MTEWLNETVETVVPHTSDGGGGGEAGDFPPMYARGARSPPGHARRASLSISGPTVAAVASPPAAQLGGSAKKRWLRQAISEEGDPTVNGNNYSCASPIGNRAGERSFCVRESHEKRAEVFFFTAQILCVCVCVWLFFWFIIIFKFQRSPVTR